MNYKKEKALAKKFIKNHNYDIKLIATLSELQDNYYTHSDRWSFIYDYLEEHYPGATSDLITGLTYYIEESNI